MNFITRNFLFISKSINTPKVKPPAVVDNTKTIIGSSGGIVTNRVIRLRTTAQHGSQPGTDIILYGLEVE